MSGQIDGSVGSLDSMEEGSESSHIYNSGEHSGYLIDNMEQFRVDSGFTDITIDVEGRQFACHKVVLAAGSPYFRSMFSSGMEECHKNVIKMQQLASDVFEQVLGFIYTGKVCMTPVLVEDLFAQAHIFQISTLIGLCVDFFEKNMKEHNCLSALTLADIHAHKPLYVFAKKFCCEHFQTLCQDDDLYRLSAECMIDLLRDRRLSCETEELVYHTALKWLEYDITQRRVFRYRILESIKFPLLTKPFLIDYASRSSQVTEDDRGRELLDDALLFHSLPARRHQLPSYQTTPRQNFMFAEVAVLLGGRLSDGLSNDVECFLADSTDFVSLKQLPFKKRNEFAVCTIGNDIYVSGGLRSAEFWKYDPVFDTWLRGTSLQHARRRHGMAAVDEQIFVLGGFDEENVLSSVEYWQLDSNKWEDGGNLNQPVENMGFATHGRRIYLFGGKNNEEVVTNCVQYYDTVTKSCTTLSCDLPANDMCLNAVLLNNYVYIIGLEGFFKFSPDTENWDILPDMSCARDFVSLAVLNEKLYALGGRRRGAKDNLYTDIIECFDPETKTWQCKGSLPVPMYSYGCVRIFLNKMVAVKSEFCVNKME